MSLSNNETYISVDIEAAGPNPCQYAMLSIGACMILGSADNFYVELQPDKDDFVAEALFVSGLKMEKLKERGQPPRAALQDFADWVAEITPPDHRPVFTAFNAPFDWMFVNEYFHRYLGYNPFGHGALDIKAFYMGLKGISWNETSMKVITKHYFGERSLTHHALRDAIDQAELFKKMLEEAQRKSV